MSTVDGDEWRVEVDLDDETGGISFGERFRSLDLDEEARRQLGGSVIVTRDGPRLFLYAETETGARAAERVIRDLIDEHQLTAEVAVTRWHPVEEAWEDATIPLPRTEAEFEAEQARLDEAETREARREGSYDWNVKVALSHRRDAVELEKSLAGDGLPVRRRFRYLTIGAPTEERAREIGTAVTDRAPADTEVWIEVNPDDLPRTPFDFVPPLG